MIAMNFVRNTWLVLIYFSGYSAFQTPCRNSLISMARYSALFPLFWSLSFLSFHSARMKASLHGFYDLEPMTHVVCIFEEVKLKQLLVTVLKTSRGFSQLSAKFIFKASLSGSFLLRPVIHAAGIFLISNWSNCRSKFWRMAWP